MAVDIIMCPDDGKCICKLPFGHEAKAGKTVKYPAQRNDRDEIRLWQIFEQGDEVVPEIEVNFFGTAIT